MRSRRRKLKGTGKGTGKGSPKDPNVAEAPQETKGKDKDKAVRKDIDSNLGKAKVLKTRADGCVSSYHDMLVSIENDPEWGFGKSKLAELKKAKTQLDTVKGLNPFVQEWALSPSFATTVKKKFTMEDLSKYLASMGKVTAAVIDLEKVVANVRGMFPASQGL